MDTNIPRLSIPAQLLYIRPVLSYVRTLVNTAGFDDREAEEIVAALETALEFIITRLYADQHGESFELACQPDLQGMTFIIHEKGMPMEPGMLPSYSPERPLDERGIEEFDIFLIGKLTDDFKFVNIGRDGKEWRLTKYLKARRIDSLFDMQDRTEPPSCAGPAEGDKFSYRLRGLTPGLALEVSKCAYRSYGYSYDPVIYYPEKIMALNDEGLLWSVIAVTDTGELIGHSALRLADRADPVGELVMGMVNPRFRNRGIFGDLTRDRIARAGEIGLRGVFIHSVTSHPASQKSSNKHGGFEATGLLLGLLPSDTEFRALTGRVVQKESAVLMFRAIGAQPVKTLYLPPRHREMIAAIYAEHSIRFLSGDSAGDPAMPQTGAGQMMVCSLDPLLNIAVIQMLHYGDDTLSELKTKFHYYRLERVDAIFCYLNLEDPAAPSYTDACEELGFFFAGILPGGLNGCDSLVLQYRNNLRIDYDLLNLYTPFSREILSYIRRMDPEST